MRREAAKRKLARRQQRRAEQLARRRKAVMVTTVATVVLIVTGLGGYAVYRAVRGPIAECVYEEHPTDPVAKSVVPPGRLDAPAAGTVSVTLATNRGAIPLTLDRAKAPCAVASFLHLTRNGYYDSTPCHRLTTEGIKVLQCGDPSGSGQGSPGYTFADETNPGLTYGRGTLAMANSGPNTNGSQFFMVYGDSPLPPNYTVFGTVGEPGLAVIDQIAAGGATGDGAPAQPVLIDSARVATP